MSEKKGYEVEIRSIKLIPGYYHVEFQLIDLPLNNVVSIPIDEWSEEYMREAIEETLKKMEKEISLLRTIITDWEGKRIKIG